MTAVKIIMDVLMAVTFIMLMDAKVISMAFHEIAGLAIGAVFLIHKLLNWKWIKNVTHHIFGKQVTAKTRIRYIIDVLLLIGVNMIIISGALMSKYVFVNAGGGDWKRIHTTLSYICIPLIGIHAGLHVKWMKNAFRKMLKITRDSKVRKWTLRVISMAFAVWGIVTSITTGFYGKMIGFGGQGNLHDGVQPGLSGSAEETETTQESRSTSGSSSDDSATVSETEEDETTKVSLEKFLSSLNCTACHKNCSLLSLRCGRGRQQQQKAIAEYESVYGDANTTESVVYTDSIGRYLQIGPAVYSLTETSSATQDVITLAESPEESEAYSDDNSENSFKGPGEGAGQGAGEQRENEGEEGQVGIRDEGGQGIWNVILTYAPIMWLFGVVGWVISRLTGRKKKAKQSAENAAGIV
jgi:hypothetical protein